MYRLPNPRHGFAGGPRAAVPPPASLGLTTPSAAGLTCPAGFFLKCNQFTNKCRCEKLITTAPLPSAAGTRDMYRLPNPRHALAGGPRAAGPHPKCPKGQVLKCEVVHVGTSVWALCECKVEVTGPIVAGEPEPLGLTGAPSPVRDEVSCPAGYDLECSSGSSGTFICQCVKGGPGNYTYATPIVSAPPRTRGLTANPHRRGHRPRYHRVANFLR